LIEVVGWKLQTEGLLVGADTFFSARREQSVALARAKGVARRQRPRDKGKRYRVISMTSAMPVTGA
jgi:hypothetical protein